MKKESIEKILTVISENWTIMGDFLDIGLGDFERLDILSENLQDVLTSELDLNKDDLYMLLYESDKTIEEILEIITTK